MAADRASEASEGRRRASVRRAFPRVRSMGGWGMAGWWRYGALVGALLVVFGTTGRADVKPDEGRRGPDAEGHGRVPQPEQGNPLEPILDLMRRVQQRLAQADSGRWTQQEQRRIVEALKFGDDAVKQLEKLIELAQQQQSSGGGGGGSSGAKAGQAGQRQRRRMRTRQADGQRRPVNPDRRQGGQRERNDDQPARNDQRRRSSAQSGGDPGQSAAAAGGKRPSEAARWGDLPMKEVREALDARRSALPPRWRKVLERYYRRLAESER